MNETYLLFYIPLVLAIMAVLEICHHDDPKVIVKRAFTNAGILTAVLVVGSLVLHVMGEYF